MNMNILRNPSELAGYPEHDPVVTVLRAAVIGLAKAVGKPLLAETFDPTTLPVAVVPIPVETAGMPRLIDHRQIIAQQAPGLRGRAQ